MTHHILVVEDNVSTRELYVDILQAYDYKVEVLLNGQEVLDYFDAPDKPRPDLLMLDINLPEKNGVYVLKYLRGKLKLHTQKILVITANHIAGQMPEMELANHIMTKPFLPKQLKETIDMVLNAPDRDIEVLITGETQPIPVMPETVAITLAEPDAKADEPEPEIDPHTTETVETRAIEPEEIPEGLEEETANVDPTVTDSLIESAESVESSSVESSEEESPVEVAPPPEKIETTNSAETAKSEAVTVAEDVSSAATESTIPDAPADIANVEEEKAV